MNISEFTSIDNEFDLNYLISVRGDKGYNINYIRDDKILVIRNHDSIGEVVNLKKVTDYVPWIMLNVKQFQCKDTGRSYDVPVCLTCSPDQDSLEKLQNIKLLASNVLYPSFSPEFTCKNNNTFHENRFKLKSNISIIYSEQGETIVNCQIFSRKSGGSCCCEQMPDGHSFLLFYMGGLGLSYFAKICSIILSRWPYITRIL